jgi:hypothetical protein
MHPVLLKLPEVKAGLGSVAYFGGEWADASCGERITIPDWLGHAPISDLLRFQADLPVGRKAVLHAIAQRWRGQRPLEIQVRNPAWAPDWAREELVDEFIDWRKENELARIADHRPLPYLMQEYETDYWLWQNWEVSSSLGIRRLTPFFNRRTLELAFATSPTALLGPGAKKPMRYAFRDDVPHRVLHREKAGWDNEPQQNSEMWTRELPDELADIVRPEFFPVPDEPLPYEERSALAPLVGYADQLDVLRKAATTTEAEGDGTGYESPQDR